MSDKRKMDTNRTAIEKMVARMSSAAMARTERRAFGEVRIFFIWKDGQIVEAKYVEEDIDRPAG